MLGGVGWGKGDRCSGFPPPDRETGAGAHRRCRGRGEGGRGTTPPTHAMGGDAEEGGPLVDVRPNGRGPQPRGVPRALACARARTRSTASEPQRPPVSIATTTKAGTACFGQTQGRWWCAFGRWRAEGHRRADRGGVMAGVAGLVRVASTASWAPWEPLCASTSIWRPSATGGARFIG